MATIMCECLLCFLQGYEQMSLFASLRQAGKCLQGSASKCTNRGWLARREATALASPNASEDAIAGGVSSFAYQGTNSHVVLGGMCRHPARVEQPQRHWQHRKFWFQACTSHSAMRHLSQRPPLSTFNI